MVALPFIARAKAAVSAARQRIGPAAAVVLIHALLLLMLLRLAPDVILGPSGGKPPLLVDLLPDREASEATETKAKAKQRQSAQSRAVATKPATAPPLPPTETVPPPPVSTVSPVWSQLIPLSRDEMAQADLSRLPQRSADRGDAASGEQAAAGDGGADGAGRGPHGERLYDADWYREPTSAELGPYLPKNGPSAGWGLIACRTVANFRVEDCVVLGQAPEGSGFGRAALNAAWQFRVRPPRIGGKSMVGEWVRIKIEYRERQE